MEQAKRKKVGKICLVIIAFVCYIAGSYLLYMVQEQIYGGVIKTRWGLAVALPIFIGFSYLLSWSEEISTDKEEKVKKESRIHKIGQWIGKVLNWLLMILFAAVIIYSLLFERYPISTFEIIAVLVVFGVLVLLKKRDKQITYPIAWMTIACYVVIAAVALIVPKAMGATTLHQATQTIQSAGYTQVTFANSYSDKVLDIVDDQVQLTEEEKETDLYLYSAQKDGKVYGVFVSPVTGDIVCQQVVDAQNGINFLLQYRK